MKKFLLSVIMLFTTAVASAAPTQVQVIWPFSPSSTHASMVRELLDSANRNQSEYHFVFVNRPGAGGTIAARAAQGKPELTLLASGSSFYVRPLLYHESHDVDQFNMVSMICQGQPIGLFSKKYRNLRDMTADSITVGVVQGSITSLVTRKLQQNLKLNIIEVPYKGTPEGVTDMLAGHVDSTIEFAGKDSTARFDDKVFNMGITGKRNHGNYVSFKNQGIRGLDNIVNDFIMFADRSVDAATLTKLNSIFNQAIDQRVTKRCENEYGSILKISAPEAARLHKENKEVWADLTYGIPKN
jgi:tripartite-type tricarboxylate transporter receptor subunit TctC